MSVSSRQKALEQQQHLHQQAPRKRLSISKRRQRLEHQQELLKQQEAQRKAMEDARIRNDQAKMHQLQDQQRHTEQEVQLERQRAANAAATGLTNSRGILRRELLCRGAKS